MDFDEPAPWPQQDDSLFTPSPNWSMDAIVQASAGDWEAYILGFKRAADMIVEQMASAPRFQELLVFPVLFLYRHFLELQMKRIIALGNALLEHPPTFPQNHSLMDIWRVCRPLIETVFLESTRGDVAIVERVIRELHSIDPDAMTFRYPVDKKSRITVPENLTRLNLAVVAETMRKLESFFDGAATGLSVYLDNKRDLEAQLGP